MFIILALCFVICPLINALSTPLMPVMGCMKDGKFYHEGAQFHPSPCEHCYCNNGRVMCAIADCFMTPCVDAVHDPTKCCPTCPNGRNCYLGNKIIPAGKAVQVDDHTTCKCPDRFGFGMTAQRAICAVKVDHVTAKIVN